MFWVMRMFGLGRDPDAEEPPVFDRGYLTRLEAHLGAGALRELLADGLFELSDRVGRAEELAFQGNLAGLATLAHDLASVAGHLGLTRLSLLAVELQHRARAEPDGDAELLSAALRRTAPPSLAMLRAYLDETAARPQNRG